MARNGGVRLAPLDALADSLEIPDSAYETASARYKDLGNWLQDDSRASSAKHQPNVYPQGSFRLGTATRPWRRDHYDLDLTCVLAEGVSADRWTQAQLKQLLGHDLEAYRRERGVHVPLDEKHRCWRLNYQDDMTFHMDIVPAVPQTSVVRARLHELMSSAGLSDHYAVEVSHHAIAITDDRHPAYRAVSVDWPRSNPEGYALWFEGRMRQADRYLRDLAQRRQLASVAELPSQLWKTPLQRSVQILKRHRDVMFERDPDVKPPSIIITTLAAKAHRGESDLGAALSSIVGTMDHHVSEVSPRVANPVNPEEDFADAWGTPEGRRLDLEGHFRRWLEQVRSDLENYIGCTTTDSAVEQADAKFGARVDQHKLEIESGSSAGAEPARSVHVIRREDVPKPWSDEEP